MVFHVLNRGNDRRETWVRKAPSPPRQLPVQLKTTGRKNNRGQEKAFTRLHAFSCRSSRDRAPDLDLGREIEVVTDLELLVGPRFKLRSSRALRRD